MKFKGTVTHLSQKGLGVVKNAQNDISYFVYGTWPGDIGEFEAIDKSINNKKFAYAKLTSLTHPSAQRQSPTCPHLTMEENACTGCPWMIADYTSQLEQKQNRFVYAMKRAGFDSIALNINPVHASPQIYGYRNRCQVKTDGVRLGFVSEKSYQIVPIKDCIVLNDKCQGLLKIALEQLPNNEWQAESVNSSQFIELDDDMHLNEMLINHKRPFKQGNTYQNMRMQIWLREKLLCNPNLGKIVELFCGSGNFTRVLSESHCTTIMAYESNQNAIQLLKAKNLPKVTPRMADLSRPLIWKNLQKEICDAETLVLDPPRAGLKRHQGFFTSFAALKTVYYISCNPETFARDAKFFVQNGWSIADIQLIDLFPHTPHIEALVEFIRA